MENPNSKETIRVIIRIRPNLYNEICNKIEYPNETSLIVTNNEDKSFQCTYDVILPPNTSQQQTYDTVKDGIESFFHGINCTILAYGQTGKILYHSLIYL